MTDASGEITNFVAVQSDITDRKLREKRLVELNRIVFAREVGKEACSANGNGVVAGPHKPSSRSVKKAIYT